MVSHSRMTMFQMAWLAVSEKLFLLDALPNQMSVESEHEGADLELL